MLPNFWNSCPKCTRWLRYDATTDSGMNDQLINITAIIHKLDVFSAHKPAILLFAIFSIKNLIPQNY